MSEFNIESESIDVERIMEQIRARINDKRGEDYTEEQIRELASVKLDRFLDPKNVRSGMVEFYQKQLKEKRAALKETPEAPPSFEFDPDVIYRSSRGFGGHVLYRIRKMLNPLLKFFFNPAPIVHALTVQQQINERQAEVINQMVRTQAEFIEIAALNYEVMNNLVVEMTRLSIEMKNHRMRVESIAGRLDFDEHRARSLEKVVQYRKERTTAAPTAGDSASEPRRRRRRRGRRRPSGAAPPQPSSDVSAGAGDGPDSADAASVVGTEPAPTVVKAGSPGAGSPSSPAPTDSSSEEPSRPQDRADATTPAARTSPGASAPPVDNTGQVSNDPASSAGDTDPSER